jgi:HEAT repeat protein
MSEFIDNNKHEEISSFTIDNMTSAEFMEDLMASYKYWGRQNREEVIEFSKRLKEILIIPLMNALADEDNTFLRSFYLSLLIGFGEFVVPYAKERLSDERWFVKRNMINILRECGTKSILKILKPYCEHKDIRVSVEAMKAFLRFDSPDAYRFIKEHLQSNKGEARDQIIKMIGTFKVERLVPDLIKLLIKKDALGGDFHLKIPIIKALGEIGDRRTLNYLLDIVKSKSLLYKSSLDQLKLAIFQSLDNYPASEIEPLIAVGLKSKDEKIIETCSVLQDKAKTNG